MMTIDRQHGAGLALSSRLSDQYNKSSGVIYTVLTGYDDILAIIKDIGITNDLFHVDNNFIELLSQLPEEKVKGFLSIVKQFSDNKNMSSDTKGIPYDSYEYRFFIRKLKLFVNITKLTTFGYIDENKEKGINFDNMTDYMVDMLVWVKQQNLLPELESLGFAFDLKNSSDVNLLLTISIEGLKNALKLKDKLLQLKDLGYKYGLKNFSYMTDVDEKLLDKLISLKPKLLSLKSIGININVNFNNLEILNAINESFIDKVLLLSRVGFKSSLGFYGIDKYFIEKIENINCSGLFESEGNSKILIDTIKSLENKWEIEICQSNISNIIKISKFNSFDTIIYIFNNISKIPDKLFNLDFLSKFSEKLSYSNGLLFEELTSQKFEYEYKERLVAFISDNIDSGLEIDQIVQNFIDSFTKYTTNTIDISKLSDNELEDIVMTFSSSLDGFKAQSKIVVDMMRGNNLINSYSTSVAENYYREYFLRKINKSTDELKNIIDLSSESENTIREGNPVFLGDDDKKKIINYLFDIFGIKLSSLDDYKSNFDLYNLLKNPEKKIDVIIIGGVIQITFKNKLLYRLFDTLFGSFSVGLCFPLPTGKNQGIDGKINLEFSKLLQVNFVNDGDVFSKDDGQNTHQHELWHAIYLLRYNFFNDYFSKKYDSLTSQDSNYPKGLARNISDTKFVDTIGKKLIDIPTFYAEFSKLSSSLPELWKKNIGIDLEKVKFDKFETTFQEEISAFIAGFLHSDDTGVLNDSNIDYITNTLIDSYLGISIKDIERVKFLSVKDSNGHYTINRKFDRDFGVAVVGEISEDQRIQQEKFDSMYIRREGFNDYYTDKYFEDMQLLVNFFINKDGYGYKTIEKLKSEINSALRAYVNLSKFRGSSFTALIELSFLPFTLWNSHVKLISK